MSKLKLADAIELVENQDSKKVPFSFRCNYSVLEGLRDYAKINGFSMGKLVNLIVTDYYNKHIIGYDMNVEYTHMDLVDRISFLEEEIESYKKGFNRISKQLNNIKDEVNRESLKKVYLEDILTE